MQAQEIEDIAKSIAEDMIGSARDSVTPVCFVTGNSYVPSLRSYPQAETVWQAAYDDNDDTDPDLFGYLYELLEDILEEADVYLGQPEYDNSLYVVDLRRFQAIEDPENAETLNGEWEAKDNA
jgi:hypothetical protein